LRRGEIWWADLTPPIGKRPVLLLSRDKAYQVRSSATVAVITRTIRNIPVEVNLGTAQGLPKSCVVNLDDILTVPKSLLVSRIAILDSQQMSLVDKAICFALDIKH
jgi:mRNA interferase MazF